jgi:hypothetical protein
MQVRRQEVVAVGLRPALLERDLGRVGVGELLRQVVDAPDAVAVRDGLDVEGEDGGHS